MVSALGLTREGCDNLQNTCCASPVSECGTYSYIPQNPHGTSTAARSFTMSSPSGSLCASDCLVLALMISFLPAHLTLTLVQVLISLSLPLSPLLFKSETALGLTWVGCNLEALGL